MCEVREWKSAVQHASPGVRGQVENLAAVSRGRTTTPSMPAHRGVDRFAPDGDERHSQPPPSVVHGLDHGRGGDPVVLDRVHAAEIVNRGHLRGC